MKTSRTFPLVLGFGTALAMWTVGFLGRLPGVGAPGWLLGPLMLAVLAGGGVVAGHRIGTANVGAAVGAVASLVNLLILGSLLGGGAPNRLAPSAALWLPGSILLGAALGLAGAAAGRRLARAPTGEPDPIALFAKIAAAGTFVLVTLGGIVTSHEAGLAVVDWPNSYGYNMFLYPLSQMVGGIYYEHAHRLFGSLVGLTTVVLSILLFVHEPRRGVRAAGVVAVVLVVAQGILGGLRVTGHFTMSDSPEITQPSLALAMAHGVTGQIFLAFMVGIAAIASRAWRQAAPLGAPGGRTDRALTVWLLAALLLQLSLGVRLRHTSGGAIDHMGFAVVVLVLAVIVSARLLGKYGETPVLQRSGIGLVGLVGVQILLGFLAFVIVGQRGEIADPPPWEVAITTTHQAVGALLLATAGLVFLWCRKLLGMPPPEGAR